MERSTEKQGPVSNESYNLNSDKLRQARQPYTSNNINFVKKINLVVTNDVSCQADIETGFRSPINESSFSITAFKNHIHSLEKKLNEKEAFIEKLLKSFQNCSYNNIVATNKHKIYSFFEDINSP